MKGDVTRETEGSAGASVPTEDAQLVRTDVNEADFRRCNRCAEPFVTRRARRQDHGQDCSGGCGLSFVSTQTNRSWIYTCTTCQRHLCTDCHAKEIGKTPVTRATGPTTTPPTVAPVPPEPQTSTSHEHLLHLSSPSWMLSLCCKQSNGSQEDWIADTRRFDFKPLTARCKQRSQHSSSNPKVMEQNGPHHPSPDSPSGTWLQTERGRNGQRQG